MTDIKPGPTPPVHLVRGAGVNSDTIESRSRLVAMLLPHAHGAIQSKDDLIDIAEWMLLGPAEEGDDS